MRRRAALRAGLGLAGAAVAGVAVAGRGRVGGSASDAPYGPLGRLPLAGSADCRVSADGRTAFVAVGDGVASVDVSEPTDPTLLAERRDIEAGRESGPLSGIADLAVDGDRLLVPGPAHPRPGRLAGFALFDVSDPGAPERVAFHETAFPIHNAALAGGRAYLTAGLALVVVDVTDDEPVELARWSLEDVDARWGDVPGPLRVLHDVRLRGDLAVLSQWDAGTWLVDVSSPDDVAVVGRAGGRPADELAAVESGSVGVEAVRGPGNHHSAALSADGSVLAVGIEAFDAGTENADGGPGGIELYDVSDPAEPARLAAVDAPPAADETRGGTWTTAHDFAFAGDRLCSAWYQGGVRLHDVSDPTAPRELAWWRRPSEAAFWTALPAAGGTVVAPSTSMPADGLGSALYVFPNRPGEQPDPPSLLDPTATPSADASSAASGESTPSASSTPTLTPTSSPSSSPTAGSSPTPTPGQPGFGAAGPVGGLAGLAAWRRWRGRSSQPSRR